MSNQEEKLREEIESDAARRVDRIISRANTDAKKLMAQVETDCEKLRVERLEDARNEGEEKARAILAGIEQAERAGRLVRRERVLDDVFAAALEQLTKQPSEARRDKLIELSIEALGNLRSAAATLSVSSHDSALLDDDAVGTICKATGIDELSVQADPDVADGVSATSADGRLAFRNTFAARLKRQRNELRRDVLNLLSGDPDRTTT